MKRIILTAAIVATMGLTACSQKAGNEAADAADTVATDADATGHDAVNDVDAAFDSAQNKMDAMGDSIDNAVDGNSMGDDAE